MSKSICKSCEPGPSADDVATLAKVAGIPVDLDAAVRIASSMGIALQGFRPVADTLPFDLDPASFTVSQNGART